MNDRNQYLSNWWAQQDLNPRPIYYPITSATQQPTNYKLITRGVTRFLIPMLFNMSSSVSAHGVELTLQQVRAPRQASNFSRAQ